MFIMAALYYFHIKTDNIRDKQLRFLAPIIVGLLLWGTNVGRSKWKHLRVHDNKLNTLK